VAWLEAFRQPVGVHLVWPVIVRRCGSRATLCGSWLIPRSVRAPPGRCSSPFGGARKARSATVRAFEMTAHGIHAALAPSCVLRVQHQRYGGPGVPLVVASKVTLLGTGESWRADDFATEPW